MIKGKKEKKTFAKIDTLVFPEEKRKEKLINIYSEFKVKPFVDLRGAISHVEFNPAEKHQYLAVHSSKIDVFDDEDQVVHNYNRFGGVQHSANFRKDGSVLCTGDEEGRIRVLRLKTSSSKRINVPLRNFIAHQAPIHQVRWTEESRIISASDDKTLCLWDILTSQRVGTFSGHGDYIRSLCIIDRNMFASGSYDHTVRIWDSRSNKSIATFAHDKPVESMVHHPTAPILVTAGGPYFKVWDMLTQKSTTHKTHMNTITTLTLNDKGTHLFSGGLDGMFRTYNFNSFDILHSVNYERPILSSAVSSDQTRILIGTNGGIIKSTREVPPEERYQLKEDTLTTLNYRNMINSFIQEKIQSENIQKIENRSNLDKFNKFLLAFRYKDSLNYALEHTEPIFVVSLLVELRNRGELHNAIEARDEVTLLPLLKFLVNNIRDGRFSRVLVEVLQIVLDIYSTVIGMSSEVDRHFRILRKAINDEIRLQHDLTSLKGSIDTLMLSSSLKNLTETN
jgi:U3 small nucleolar RNA-associated protein 15